MKRFSSIFCFVLLFGFASTAFGQEDAAQAEATEAASESTPPQKPEKQAQSLDELLDRVRMGWNAERDANLKREQEFRRNRDQQQRLLEQARATLAREEARSEALEARYQANEASLAELEKALEDRLGSLGELFGVVRQVASDAGGQVTSSLVSAQLPGRFEFLDGLAQSKSLPSIPKLERLWAMLQEEMTELGRVTRFEATVVDADGQEQRREVIRVGAFNALADGKYLVLEEKDGEEFLLELPRQPGRMYLSTVASFEKLEGGMGRLALDPSRGSILKLLVQTPSARERIQQGGPIGYSIIVLGLAAGLVGIIRWLIIMAVGRKVAAQQKADSPSSNNPLGRVLSVFEENRTADMETLELKLDETIMRESSRLERFLWLVKVVSVVAPLLGLLGTVTGMIRTFQAITLYGAGDPKMMASGISEALVTTMLGLFVAIPLVLLHAIVSSGSKGVVEVIEEQAAGMVAQRAERRDAVA